MINQELLNYIKTQLDRGVSKEAIQKALLDNKWESALVNEAFRAVGNSPQYSKVNITEESSFNKQENILVNNINSNAGNSKTDTINNSSYVEKGKIGRSFLLVKESFQILKKDKEVMWFPIISSIVVFVVNIVFLVVTFMTGIFNEETAENFDVKFYLVLFVFYLVSYFIVTFFNTGLVTCANIRLNGGDPTFKDGMDNAKKHVSKIFLWALFAATVGIILQIISDKSKWLGKLVVSLLNLTWSLATFFIVPVLIFENYNVFDSLKQSGSLFAKTWGENVVGQISMSLFFGLLSILGIIPLIVAIVVGDGLFILLSFVLMIAFWIILGVISASLNGIFKTALYNYAKTGQVSYGYSSDVFQSAFAPKKK